MNILLNNGLNLNDPKILEPADTAIALNADYRQDGVVRSRLGLSSLYTSQGINLIGSANGDVYSVGTDIYRNGTALGTSLTSPISIGVSKLYNVTTEALFVSGSVNKKVEGSTVYQWGIDAPTAAPTAVDSGAGSGPTGTYYYKYTYVRKSGSTLVAESNPSPISLVLSITDNLVNVTWTASSDSQVTHVRLYRTLNNGSGDDYFYVAEQAIGDVTYDDTSIDSALGTQIQIDNDPPPATSLNCITGPGAFGRMFVATSNKLYFSKAQRPESFPALNYIEVGVPNYPILNAIDWYGVIYMFTRIAVYQLQGSDENTFYPVKTMVSRGLVARNAIVATDTGIIYLGYDGIYMFNGQNEVKLTGAKVDPLFRGETVNGISPINQSYLSTCWMIYFKGKLFLGYPSGIATSPNMVLVLDTEKKKFAIYDYSLTITSAFVDEANSRLLFGASTGTIWIAETGENDGGGAFTFKVRSKEFASLEKVSPSVARYDIYNEGGNTVTVKYLDDTVSRFTHTLTDSDNHKRRMISPIFLDSFQLEIESSVTSRVSIGLLEVS